MSRLRRRVGNVGHNHKRAMAAYAPAREIQPSPAGGAASPSGAPGVMPLAQVTVYPDPAMAGYSTIAYTGLAPIYTADGAAVPATSPGRWAQLAAAGRP